MFVTGKRRYVSGVASLAVGHHYSIDSHMGGSYTTEYIGIEAGSHRFKNLSREFAGLMPFFNVPEADLTTTIFCIVPDNVVYCKWQDENRQKNGIHPEHEIDCPACRKEAKCSEPTT